jgi:hypothetical protein
MQAPDTQVIITRTGPHQYRLEPPLSAEGDGDAIASLLGDLQALKAKDFVAEAPASLAPYGLEAPRLRATVSEEPPEAPQESSQHTLLFGDNAPDQSGTYVRVAERPTIYLVDRTSAQRVIGTTAFDLRNKKILAFDTETVQKIHLQYPTSVLTLERRGEAWRLSEPIQQTIQQRWKVDHLLAELSTLEYTKIVAESPDDGARYGLDMPRVQITLWQKDHHRLGPLVIGKAADTTTADSQLVYYTQAGSDTPLYAIEADFLATLPKTPPDLTTDK